MSVAVYLISIIITLASVVFYLIRRRLNYWKELGIQHDEPSLLEGNFQGLMRTRSFYEISKETYLKYRGTGPFCGFYFFQRPGVMLLDINLIKHVLIKDFSNFVDRGMYHNEEDDPLTGHLFLLDGQKWRALRNKLSPTFTSGKMKVMFPTVVKVAEEFINVFGEMIDQNTTVEIRELLARFTTDVIGTCAFGIQCNSLKDPNAEFREMGRRSLTDRRHNHIISSFIRGFPKLARKLHFRMIPDHIHEFFLRIVRETVDYRKQNNIQRNDFLSILMELGNEKQVEGDSDDCRGLTIEQMAAQAFVFFLGGFETSSTTMGYVLYELALNPHIQERLRQEVMTAFKKHNNEFTYECMKDMQYMDQVTSETLRKYTIVPVLNREALHDFTVPGNSKYVIRKGMPILIPTIGIHNDPDLYPNPDVFDPERFAPEELQKRESVTWLAFGDGPRNCIGLRFGKMQMRIGLSFLLRNFKFSTCHDTEVPLIFNKKSFLTSTINGIFLKVERL